MRTCATKMAAGMYTTAPEGPGARQRGVTPNVLFADTHVLSALDACGDAHLCSGTCPPPRTRPPAWLFGTNTAVRGP